jgi:molybdate transport system substrate-binding protein
VSAACSPMHKVLVTLVAVLGWVLLGAQPVHAADIKVLTAGALKPVVLAMAPAFEQRTGHRLTVENDTAGALSRRIAAGEAYDVAVLTPAFLAPLLSSGQVVATSVTPLARVGVGVAVRAGAPVPDISDAQALRQTLLAARSIAWIDPAAGGSSGIYMAGVYERMGIAAQVRAKSILVPGGLTAQRLVTGEADLAIQQMSELLVVAGVTVVGPIPADLQNYTVYSAVISPQARDAQAAAQLIAALLDRSVRDGFRSMGLQAP